MMIFRNLKSQSSVEFISLVAFMTIAVFGFLIVTSSNVLEAKEEANKKIAQDISDFAYREIEIAKSVNDGYIRVFVMPQTVNGVNYTINITDDRELIVSYLDYEFIRFIPANVTGNIAKGSNKIKKINGVVYLQPIVECNDELDNDIDNSVDMEDAGCTNILDDDETNCGDGICESVEKCYLCSSDCGPCVAPSKLLFKNQLFNALYINQDGNAVLKGTLEENSARTQMPNDEFVVKDRNGNAVAIVDLTTGDMFIQGLLREQQTLQPNPLSNDLMFRNSDGEIVSIIEESGDFLLKGTLTQNGNP